MVKQKNTTARKIVVNIPEGLSPNAKTLQVLGDTGIFMECPYEIRDVIIKKSEQEKKYARRAYRKDYVTRPIVQEKIKQRLNDPETIKKRKEYAEREEVKQRKKELAARARQVRKLLKEEEPETYNRLVSKLLHD